MLSEVVLIKWNSVSRAVIYLVSVVALLLLGPYGQAKLGPASSNIENDLVSEIEISSFNESNLENQETDGPKKYSHVFIMNGKEIHCGVAINGDTALMPYFLEPAAKNSMNLPEGIVACNPTEVSEIKSSAVMSVVPNIHGVKFAGAVKDAFTICGPAFAIGVSSYVAQERRDASHTEAQADDYSQTNGMIEMSSFAGGLSWGVGSSVWSVVNGPDVSAGTVTVKAVKGAVIGVACNRLGEGVGGLQNAASETLKLWYKLATESSSDFY